MIKTVLTLALSLGCALPALSAPAPRPETLSDSTVVRSWTLDNGLRVIARHVPKARAVAITVGYSVGSDDDPAGMEGLGQALGELEFMAAAGDIPARTHEELDSQRELGWSFPVSRRTTLLTEVATVDQFPGVLNQVATRMRGVTVTKEGLDQAVTHARSELNQDLFGSALGALYYQVREAAMDTKDEDIVHRAGGRGLGKLTLAEAQQDLRSRFVPANAVLSLAGDLDRVDLVALVANLFGSIPTGTPLTHGKGRPLAARARVINLNGIAQPQGVVGVIAPALEDSLHPSFYLNALILGSHFNHVWLRDQEGIAPNRYHYAIFDEPDLMRIFPAVAGGETKTDALGQQIVEALSTFSSLIVTREPYEELRQSVLWLLGGPLGEDLKNRVPNEPALLHTLSRAQAGRAICGGEAFWEKYRVRFENERPGGLGRWLDYFRDPQHQVRLLMVPHR